MIHYDQPDATAGLCGHDNRGGRIGVVGIAADIDAVIATAVDPTARRIIEHCADDCRFVPYRNKDSKHAGCIGEGQLMRGQGPDMPIKSNSPVHASNQPDYVDAHVVQRAEQQEYRAEQQEFVLRNYQYC